MSAQPPLFTARLDPARGIVRISGRLDPLSADLLRGTLRALHRDGHRRITVDIGDPGTQDPAARALLATLVTELSEAGVRLTVDDHRRAPWPPAGLSILDLHDVPGAS